MPNEFKSKTVEWDKIQARVKELHGLFVKVGIQGPKAAAKHDAEGDLTNAQIAAIHEFSGPTDSPPGRAFIRPVYDNNPSQWQSRLGEMAKRVMVGMKPKAALRLLGEQYRSEVIDRMKAGIPPPLSERTIAARNRGKDGANPDVTPLIDTGTLMGAISVEVAKKDGT